jgi:hypothetical protein
MIIKHRELCNTFFTPSRIKKVSHYKICGRVRMQLHNDTEHDGNLNFCYNDFLSITKC